MTIRHIPLQPAKRIFSPQTKMREVVEFFLEARVNHATVCDGDSYRGIVGVNEVLEAILPVGTKIPHGLADLTFVGEGSAMLGRHLRDLLERPAADFLMPEVPPLPEDCPLTEAVLLLTKKRIPLPVIRNDGSFKGMLSRRALLQYLQSKA